MSSGDEIPDTTVEHEPHPATCDDDCGGGPHVPDPCSIPWEPAPRPPIAGQLPLPLDIEIAHCACPVWKPPTPDASPEAACTACGERGVMHADVCQRLSCPGCDRTLGNATSSPLLISKDGQTWWHSSCYAKAVA